MDAKPEAASPARRWWPLSWRGWTLLGLAVLALALRAALPVILQRVIPSQMQGALEGRLAVGDVDLWILGGAVALNDVALYPDGATPSPGDAEAAGDAPDAAPEAPAQDGAPAHDAAPGRAATPARPLVAWKRVYLNVAWLPLLDRTARIEDFELDGLVLNVARRPDGSLVLPEPKEPAPAPEPAPEESAPWAVRIDRAAIREALLRVRDEIPEPAVEREIELPSLEVSGVDLVASDGAPPGTAVLQARLSGGTIRVETKLETLAEGFRADAQVGIEDLPLDRLHVHEPILGWTDSAGRLDAALHVEAATTGQIVLSGDVAVRDLAIRAAGEEKPVLAWKSLAISLEEIDVVEKRADLARVDLDGLRVVAHPLAPAPLPLLAGLAREEGEPGAEDAPPAPTTAAKRAADAADPEPTTAAPLTAETAGSAPTKLSPSEEAAAPAPKIASKPAASEPDEGPASSAAWQWRVGAVELDDARATVTLAPPPLEIELVHAAVSGLASAPGSAARVTATLRRGDGTIDVEADAILEPLDVGARVRVEKLALEPLARAAGTVPVALGGGELGASLEVDFAPGSLDVTGTVSVADFSAGLPEGSKEFGVAWDRLEVDVGKAHVPLATAAAESAPAPRIDLAAVRWSAPSIRVTRTGAGIVLPGSAAAEATPRSEDQPTTGDATPRSDGEPATGDATPRSEGPPMTGDATPRSGDEPTTAPDSQPTTRAAPPTDVAPDPRAGEGEPVTAAGVESPADAPDGAADAPLALTLRELSIDGATLAVVDRTVRPFYRGKVSSLKLEARALAYPESTFESFSLSFEAPGAAPLAVRGESGADGITVESDLQRLGLAQFNPYASQAAGVTVRRGTASLQSRVRWSGERYAVRNDLSLDDLEMGGSRGESLFQDHFGISLAAALALMRDVGGRISLSIPFKGSAAEGASVDLAPVIVSALTKAILGAVLSPLKILGAVTLSGDKVEEVAPSPVAFRPGSTEIEPSAGEQVEKAAGVLASVPGLRLELGGVASAADVRALEEAAVLASLEGEGTFLGGIRNLASGGSRSAIREALRARAKGEPGALEPEDEAELTELIAAVGVTDEQLRELAAARAERLRAVMSEDHGVPDDQLRLAEPRVDRAGGRPEVTVAMM